MYETLEETAGIHFENTSLLQQALVHRSYIYESAGEGLSSNERLEFLGDSILAFISADYLFRTFPELNEGELSDLASCPGETRDSGNVRARNQSGKFPIDGKGRTEQWGKSTCTRISI